MWPGDKDVLTKLQGSRDELLKTTQFIRLENLAQRRRTLKNLPQRNYVKGLKNNMTYTLYQSTPMRREEVNVNNYVVMVRQVT